MPSSFYSLRGQGPSPLWRVKPTKWNNKRTLSLLVVLLIYCPSTFLSLEARLDPIVMASGWLQRGIKFSNASSEHTHTPRTRLKTEQYLSNCTNVAASSKLYSILANIHQEFVLSSWFSVFLIAAQALHSAPPLTQGSDGGVLTGTFPKRD